MKYTTGLVLSGSDIGRSKKCQHGAKPSEHCSGCDSGTLHILHLNDEEMDAVIRALRLAADFHNDTLSLNEKRTLAGLIGVLPRELCFAWYHFV